MRRYQAVTIGLTGAGVRRFSSSPAALSSERRTGQQRLRLFPESGQRNFMRRSPFVTFSLQEPLACQDGRLRQIHRPGVLRSLRRCAKPVSLEASRDSSSVSKYVVRVKACG